MSEEGGREEVQEQITKTPTEASVGYLADLKNRIANVVATGIGAGIGIGAAIAGRRGSEIAGGVVIAGVNAIFGIREGEKMVNDINAISDQLNPAEDKGSNE